MQKGKQKVLLLTLGIVASAAATMKTPHQIEQPSHRHMSQIQPTIRQEMTHP